jgi:hypothetical protein
VICKSHRASALCTMSFFSLFLRSVNCKIFMKIYEREVVFVFLKNP